MDTLLSRITITPETYIAKTLSNWENRICFGLRKSKHARPLDSSIANTCSAYPFRNDAAPGGFWK